VIKKKLANLIDKGLPLLYSFNVGLDLTEFGRNLNINHTTSDLTKNGKDASPILPLDQNHNKELDFMSQESIKNHNKTFNPHQANRMNNYI
jgi:hypothetical protein